MIRGYQSAPTLEPTCGDHLQWGPALGAGLIAGAILIIAPRGAPWAALTSFSPAIMGRAVSPGAAPPLPAVWIIHLLLAMVYGVIIARVVSLFRGAGAILLGGALGVGLYFVNWAIVSLVWPTWQGSEVTVVFTHIVFGLIAAGAYRGLLRRKPVSVT